MRGAAPREGCCDAAAGRYARSGSASLTSLRYYASPNIPPACRSPTASARAPLPHDPMRRSAPAWVKVRNPTRPPRLNNTTATNKYR
ncbi:hypothetical protein EVAR_79387_1 [Eumeta japonica]|uniref:Uncharacterized protein n=1 Tax=Eumeta variegata TaxID=151549 RepID=A0A4C1VIB2_EUMVA|nr:hypothetical protein EVAR_79387_1 [Eumeta japonica]